MVSFRSVGDLFSKAVFMRSKKRPIKNFRATRLFAKRSALSHNAGQIPLNLVSTKHQATGNIKLLETSSYWNIKSAARIAAAGRGFLNQTQNRLWPRGVVVLKYDILGAKLLKC